MLALFAEGERLLRLIESGNTDLVINDLPIWQAQIVAEMEKNVIDVSAEQRDAQLKLLQEVTQRIALALSGLSLEMQKEMSAVQKQHSIVKAYMVNSH